MKTTSKTPVVMKKSHKLRTFFAALFGAVAVWLLLTSVLAVWLNRTLTDTTTFSATMAPLVSEPAIQNFVADKVTDQLSKAASLEDMAATLLKPEQVAGKTPEQVKVLLQSTIRDSVLQIVRSPSFATLWKSTITTTHQQLISQLNSNSSELSFDLTPAINGVVNELKQTSLAPVSDKIEIKPDTGKLNIKSAGIAKVQKFYKLFKAGTLAIVVLALVMLALSVWISVNHSKTIRRILVTVGVWSLVTGLLLAAPRFVKVDGADKAAAVAVVQVLVHNLMIASIVIGVVCIVLAIASKLWSKRHA